MSLKKKLGGTNRNNVQIFNDPPRQVGAYFILFGLNCFAVVSLLLSYLGWGVSAAKYQHSSPCTRAYGVGVRVLTVVESRGCYSRLSLSTILGGKIC